MSAFITFDDHRDEDSPPKEDGEEASSNVEGVSWEISFSSQEEQKPKRSIPKFLLRERKPRTEQLKKDLTPPKPVAKSPSSKSKSPPSKTSPKASKPGQSRSPVPSQSRSPVPSQSRSPVLGKSRSPVPSQSRSPVSKSLVPGQSRSPIPGRSRSPLSRPFFSPQRSSPDISESQESLKSQKSPTKSAETSSGPRERPSSANKLSPKVKGPIRRPNSSPNSTLHSRSQRQREHGRESEQSDETAGANVERKTAKEQWSTDVEGRGEEEETVTQHSGLVWDIDFSDSKGKNKPVRAPPSAKSRTPLRALQPKRLILPPADGQSTSAVSLQDMGQRKVFDLQRWWVSL